MKKIKEKNKIVYNIPNSKSISLLREQLGLNLYTPEQQNIPSLEISHSKFSKVSFLNDIDLNQWKEYGEIITDSLWLLGARDKSGAHTGELHGNFIPQIPHQAMLRYTKKDEIVLDTFLGSGTTLIECKKLGRNGIGIELLPDWAQKAKSIVQQEQNPYNVKTKVITGDSADINTIESVNDVLKKEFKKNFVQLIIMHPPYYDIIKFSDNPKDLCNTTTLEEFLNKFKKVVENTYPLLDNKRFLTLVIGDKYSKGEWVPLSFYVMQKVMECGYKLKSIVIKNIVGNRAKRNVENFWRRRALTGGFYIFKHEYIMFFQKV